MTASGALRPSNPYHIPPSSSHSTNHPGYHHIPGYNPQDTHHHPVEGTHHQAEGNPRTHPAEVAGDPTGSAEVGAGMLQLRNRREHLRSYPVGVVGMGRSRMSGMVDRQLRRLLLRRRIWRVYRRVGVRLRISACVLRMRPF